MQKKVQFNYKVIDLFEVKKFVFIQIKITLKVMVFLVLHQFLQADYISNKP